SFLRKQIPFELRFLRVPNAHVPSTCLRSLRLLRLRSSASIPPAHHARWTDGRKRRVSHERPHAATHRSVARPFLSGGLAQRGCRERAASSGGGRVRAWRR